MRIGRLSGCLTHPTAPDTTGALKPEFVKRLAGNYPGNMQGALVACSEVGISHRISKWEFVTEEISGPFSFLASTFSKEIKITLLYFLMTPIAFILWPTF